MLQPCYITEMFIPSHLIIKLPESLESYTNIVTSNLRNDYRIYVTYL